MRQEKGNPWRRSTTISGSLGGGAAGHTAAAGAAQFGAKTILIGKAKKLVGGCLHFGCVPSRTLIRTAGVWSLALLPTIIEAVEKRREGTALPSDRRAK